MNSEKGSAESSDEGRRTSASQPIRVKRGPAHGLAVETAVGVKMTALRTMRR